MRASVRAAFLDFTAPLEGVVPWMYLDVKGLVTVGIGNLIDPVGYAMALPFVRATGAPATRDEIAREWAMVKGATYLAKAGHRAAASFTSIRLTPEGVRQVVMAKLDEIDGYLSRRFPDWEAWPADAQLATLSMSWACGAGFHFMQLERALRAQDFSTAARECTIREEGNPGVIQRNRANRILYRNAAQVVQRVPELDPDTLYWPASLPDETPTAPRLPADTEPDAGLVTMTPEAFETWMTTGDGGPSEADLNAARAARITGTEEALRGGGDEDG